MRSHRTLNIQLPIQLKQNERGSKKKLSLKERIQGREGRQFGGNKAKIKSSYNHNRMGGNQIRNMVLGTNSHRMLNIQDAQLINVPAQQLVHVRRGLACLMTDQAVSTWHGSWPLLVRPCWRTAHQSLRNSVDSEIGRDAVIPRLLHQIPSEL